jgi:diguanylate cyclase (GGDEF)-like protein
MGRMTDTDPFGSFHEASKAVLNHLHQMIGFNLWMVTRTEGDDWIVLEANDFGYGVGQGDVFRWTDSFCSRMVQGQGPRVAPCAASIPSYAAAPIGQQVSIGAYVGVPLSWDDGRLFGTLCAIDPSPQPKQIEESLAEVELFARLLSSILQADIQANKLLREAERAHMDAMTDVLTGLYNRRGWDQLIAAEESRSQRYGHPAGVFSIDVDDLKTVNDTQGHAKGDELLRAAADAVTSTVRAHDVAARLGGDEFAVLAVECDPLGTESIMKRLEQEFGKRGVRASMGVEICQPGEPFAVVLERADQAMYANKRERKKQSDESQSPIGVS